jgi:hypothetical protein
MTGSKLRRRRFKRIWRLNPNTWYSTSEFNDVKARLMMLHGRQKLDTNSDPSRPTLRRAPGSGNGPVDANDDGTKPKTDEDERPTLKRRDGGG